MKKLITSDNRFLMIIIFKCSITSHYCNDEYVLSMRQQ
ncbi:hypothetical protein AB37_5110 [Escherichia coli 8-415-05_S1_C2]|nr:hypothetical protein AB09_4809 [Escherichia coli 8-415-05_S1_C1]KEO16471.1 hypothetical protein AB37_5110 [Escherichia coli 8-415-05_S1_C2]